MKAAFSLRSSMWLLAWRSALNIANQTSCATRADSHAWFAAVRAEAARCAACAEAACCAGVGVIGGARSITSGLIGPCDVAGA